MNVTEDFFIPIRGDKSSKIDTLPGASNMDQIADLEFLQNKLFASLQVPKNYLNYGENLPGGSTLSQQDLRFSRTINSIQQAVLAELRRVANIHLYFSGFKEYIDNFDLTLTNPSTQQELMKLETQKARLEVFKEFYSPDATSPASYTWAMENILGFSKSEIKLMLKQKKIEKKIFAEIDAGASTYKKIGLFKELDDRYEIPGASQITPAEGEDGGGGDNAGFQASSALGGGADMDASSLEDMGANVGGTENPTGAETTTGSEAPSPEIETPEKEPVSESINRAKKIVKLIDKNIDSMIEELLGEEIKKKTQEELIEENPFTKKHNSLNSKTKKMLQDMENKFADKKRVNLQEYEIVENYLDIENPLLKTNKMLNIQADLLKKDIDFIIETKKIE